MSWGEKLEGTGGGPRDPEYEREVEVGVWNHGRPPAGASPGGHHGEKSLSLDYGWLAEARTLGTNPVGLGHREQR